MASPAIELESLRKTFRVPERARGFRGALRSLVAPRTREVVAVDDVSFAIAPGERVAFVGPNGAGKSTTLKMLAGVLYPTAGRARVLDLEPARERTALCFRIGAVFGQRSQLWYHLPAANSFDLLARIYEIEPSLHRARLAELVAAFDIADVVERPVRQLSLGERMRCELVASLLHRPEILFLDEPTIGLDVVAKARIRDLVRDRAARDGCTVLLTSHDTGDMEGVCDRVLVIHRGRLVVDEPLRALRGVIRTKRITVVCRAPEIALDLPGVRRLPAVPHRVALEVDVERTPVDRVVTALIASGDVLDLCVEDPPMEEIIQAIYARAPHLEEDPPCGVPAA